MKSAHDMFATCFLSFCFAAAATATTYQYTVADGAYSINNLGEVVGFSQTSSGSRAFLWKETAGMLDLNSLVDPAVGWVLNEAHDINDVGQIVGHGTYLGSTRAFLLTPLPEPSSLVWVGFGCYVASRRRRRGIGPFVS